jgi:N-acetylmuramoyl-L-alanine amidase
MATINLIDPTGQNLAGNTNYENLFIYVDMTAERKGNTSFDFDTNNANTSDLKVVNLLGYKRQGNKSIFTTDYSYIYNDDNIYEGFGIKSIKIETNASYVPKVTVEFLDTKGMAFFNNPQKSPYSILFDFPPPIFTLKVKGYYGRTLEYKLHMLRHNTKFDADTGNFTITAEFVGNTFAPLSDILFQNVLMVSKLEGQDVTLGAKNSVDSLADLVAKSKTIKTEVIDKLKNLPEYKNLLDLSDQLSIKRDAYKKEFNFDENTAIIEINKKNLPTALLDNQKYKILRNISLVKLAENIENNTEYFIISYGDISKISKEIFTDSFPSVKIDDTVINFNNSTLAINYFDKTYNLTIKIKDSFNKNINYLNITDKIRSVKKIMDDDELLFSNNYQTINQSTKQIIKEQLGFEPTVRNVIEVICNDIDKWINKLIEVYNLSSSTINNNTRLKQIYNTVSEFYPFPDFTENGKKSLPRYVSDDLYLEEVKFTDDFIEKFINYKKEIQNEENRNTGNLVGDNNENIWFPINPLDSRYFNNKSNNPYMGFDVDSPKVINSIFVARLYIYIYYTFGNSFDSKILSNFYYNEKEVILKSIKNSNLLSAYQNYLNGLIFSSNETKIDNLNLDYELINKYINIIVNNLNINPIEFSGIELSASKNILKTNIPSYIELKKLNDDQFGLTLNDKNNIIFYDGNNKNKTAFRSIVQEGPTELNKVILDSINIEAEKNRLAKGSGNNLIKNTSQINNLIYDYYFNYKSDNYKKIYGALHIMYTPINLDFILNNPLIVEMPLLAQLYISSLVYAIEKNILEVDLEYFDKDKDKKLISEDNKDYIYNLYSKNFNSGTSFLKKNILDNRVNLITKLKNLSKTDKEKFIKFYIDKVDTRFNSINLFINSLLDSQGKFKLGIYNISEIDTSEIDFLFEKSVFIINSKLTFSNRDNYRILSVNDKTSLINPIFNNITNIKEFKNIYVGNLKSNIPSELTKRNSQNNDANEVKITQEVRIETYYSFKNFVDRWLKSNNNNTVSIDDIFYGIKNGKLINLFQFVDRAFNSDIAETAIIDISILQEFENDYSVNMLTVIGKLLNENGFDFYPLQNFISYRSNTWDANEVFMPQISDIDVSLKAPKFTCMYIGGTSKYLDSNYNSKTSFKNDGIMNIQDAQDFSDSTDAFGFRVRFGDGKQSIFTKIDVGTEEVQPTNESLKAMSLIIDGGDKNAIPIAQNLFSTYEQRSYTCKVTMFGNAMIQPTQYFMLENIPMFAGLYLITKIDHEISGENNSMFTTFEGVRLPKEPRPFITNSFDVYVKNLADKILLDPLTGEYKVTATSTNRNNINKKDRTIYLIAGHYNNDNGASTRINDNEYVYEKDLTIDLRDRLKKAAEAKNIKVTVDNDNFTLQQVIVNLKQNITQDDIVFDIHFNAYTDISATGVEVLIKDSNNQETIELAKEVVDVISNTLGIVRRKGEYDGLPIGVKLQDESARGDLGIFDVNTTVILIEVCFMTNPEEYTIYQSQKDTLVNNLVNLFVDVTRTTNDQDLIKTKTFNILNTLNYTNLNTRTAPFIIPNETIFNNLIGFTNFINSSKNNFRADNLISAYIDSSNIYYKNTLRNQIQNTSQKYNIDSLFLAGILYIESNFNPVAISFKKNGEVAALGIGQFIINAAMSDTLRYLNENKTITTSVYLYNQSNHQYESQQKTYSQILDYMFDNNSLNNITFGDNKLESQLKNKKVGNKTYYDILLNNIFNNPFIMIEFSGIYLTKKLEGYVGTSSNKNAGILSFSYNVGNFKLKENSTDRPYFDHLVEYYISNKTPENIKDKIVRKVKNEGIEYPERLINEYLTKFITINLDQGNII